MFDHYFTEIVTNICTTEIQFVYTQVTVQKVKENTYNMSLVYNGQKLQN